MGVTIKSPVGGDGAVDVDRRRQLVHRTALVTAVVSLLPIGLGSLVTTLGAGMAFLDWPSSDGHGMLAYPWLRSSGDKFVEHGHRLAGVLIGLCSVVLCGIAWAHSLDRAVRIACSLVLAGVVVQGLIGGLRVRLDRSTVALAHSVFGCLVFVALWMTAEMTRLSRASVNCEAHRTVSRSILAVIFPSACLSQYVIGGFVRHLGVFVDWHLAGAVLVTLCSIWVVCDSLRSGSLDLRTAGRWVLLSVLIQVLVGLMVWGTKFGFPPIGVVAVHHSLLQITARSLHTITGMSVVATAVYWSVVVLRSRRAMVA